MDRSLLRFVYLLVAIASIFIIILGLRTAATLINAILLAALITIAIVPVASWLVKKGWTPTMAVVGTLLVVVAVLALLVFLTWVSVSRITASMEISVMDMVAALPAIGEPEQMDEWLEQLQVLSSDEEASQVLTAVVTFLGPFISQTITVLMILIFMLSAAITTPISQQLEIFSKSTGIDRLTDVTRDVQHYISITTVINLITGLLTTIFLWIAGVDFAVLWGIMTWLFGYIPVVGFWIALIPPVFLAWEEFGLPRAIMVFVVITLINGATENFIKPRVMGESLKLSPLVIFVSLVFWGWVLGAAGAILAVPLTLLVAGVLDSFEETRWMTALIRVTPVEPGERQVAFKRLHRIWESAGDLWRGGAQ
jgi:predicted PurR-regulated permease PerM